MKPMKETKPFYFIDTFSSFFYLPFFSICHREVTIIIIREGFKKKKTLKVFRPSILASPPLPFVTDLGETKFPLLLVVSIFGKQQNMFK